MQRKPPVRDAEFLKWAHSRPADCAVCGNPAQELHHLENGGMGRRGSDLLVAPICIPCHLKYQGKRRIAVERMTIEEAIAWGDMWRAAAHLLEEYLEER